MGLKASNTSTKCRKLPRSDFRYRLEKKLIFDQSRAETP